MDVRNAIEHHDVRPPSLTRCRELLDVVWYFLRTTDQLAKLRHEEFTFFDPTDDSLRYNVGFQPRPERDWRIEVSGNLSPQFISKRRYPSRIEIVCDLYRVRDKSPLRGRKGVDRPLRPGTISFSGSVSGPPEAVAALIKHYFALI